MPSTINGIGTWYWGKRNHHRIMGTCESCGAYVELSSFDTTLYFVVLFVPIIPLGRKRVIRQCPRCTRHRSMSLREWEEAKRKAAGDVAAKLRDGADFPAAVKEAVGAFVAFEDEEAFLALAGRARDRIGGDAEALATLGAGYACFGRPAEAEAAYRASLAVEDDPRVRETLAGNLIVQGRPDEAAPLLTHVIAEKRKEQIGDLYALAAGYQANGMHRKALALLEGIAEAFPDEESEADYRRLGKISRKHEATGKPVRSPSVASSRRGRPKGSPSPKAWAVLGSAAAVAALTIYLAVAWWGGRSRDVWLVSGIARAYDVSVAGEVHTVPPMSHLKIAVAEGDIRVKVLDEGLGIPEETCRIRTPFLSRPFLDRTYVINPDRVAVVLSERAIYTVSPGGDAPSPHVLVGRTLYELKDIDYEFQPFPATLRTEGNRLVKRRVAQLRDHSPAETIAALNATCGKADVVAFLERNALYAPETDVYLMALTSMVECARVVEFVRPLLARRPILVNWHRMYQWAMERHDPEHDLGSEYQALLAGSPGDGDLLYLVGRVARDRGEALSLFRRAAAAERPSPFALYSLAYDALGQGSFEEALDLSGRAVEALPRETAFQHAQQSALLALGRIDELLEKRRAARRRSKVQAVHVPAELMLLVAKGDVDGARKTMERSFRRMQKEFGAKDAATWRVSLEASILYAEGDAEGYAKLMGRAPAFAGRFDVLLTSGRLEEARKAVEAAAKVAAEGAAQSYLAVFIAAGAAGESALARECLDAAAEGLRAGGVDEKRAADVLTAEAPPGEEEARALVLAVGLKRLVLTALGVRFPAERERYWPLARRLNFDPSFPHLLLKEVLGDARGREGSQGVSGDSH